MISLSATLFVSRPDWVEFFGHIQHDTNDSLCIPLCCLENLPSFNKSLPYSVHELWEHYNCLDKVNPRRDVSRHPTAFVCSLKDEIILKNVPAFNLDKYSSFVCISKSKQIILDKTITNIIYYKHDILYKNIIIS